ncbi:hypothetical protein MnBA_22730 [Marinobacterium sp. BA1]
MFDAALTGIGEVAMTSGNLDIRADACGGEAVYTVYGQALFKPATELPLLDKKVSGKMERHVFD